MHEIYVHRIYFNLSSVRNLNPPSVKHWPYIQLHHNITVQYNYQNTSFVKHLQTIVHFTVICKSIIKLHNNYTVLMIFTCSNNFKTIFISKSYKIDGINLLLYIFPAISLGVELSLLMLLYNVGTIILLILFHVQLSNNKTAPRQFHTKMISKAH